MDIKVEGKNLVITVPLLDEKSAPLSSSGKNKVLYSSGGFQQVGKHRVNLTVIPGK